MDPGCAPCGLPELGDAAPVWARAGGLAGLGEATARDLAPGFFKGPPVVASERGAAGALTPGDFAWPGLGEAERCESVEGLRPPAVAPGLGAALATSGLVWPPVVAPERGAARALAPGESAGPGLGEAEAERCELDEGLRPPGPAPATGRGKAWPLGLACGVLDPVRELDPEPCCWPAWAPDLPGGLNFAFGAFGAMPARSTVLAVRKNQGSAWQSKISLPRVAF